jgi:hypothetical protein
MTATDTPDLAPPARPAAEQLILKIPFWGKSQNIVYSLGLIQWAVGIITAGYILVTQGRYRGFSFKKSWDGLNQIWHFRAIPGIGNWLYENWDLGRHFYFRNILESVLAFAFVAMIVPKLATRIRAKVPLAHRIMVALHIPSPYQGRFTVRHGRRKGQPRRADTTGLQYVFLFPSVWVASWPGQIVMSVILFGAMALGHRAGFTPSWFQPEGVITAGPVRIPWVPILIGVAGGKLWGHSPAGKAGADIQRRLGLDRRLSVYYLAEKLLDQFAAGEITRDKALAQLTALPDALPSQLYPATYRHWYQRLLAERAPARPITRLALFMSRATVLVLIILGAYGIYAQRWGIPHHDLWIP